MRRRICRSLALVALLVVAAAPAVAKGPVVKIVLSGPDLAEPVEITAPDAIDVHVWGATFIDRELGPQEWVSASPVPPYMIQFHVELPRDGVRMMYVVYFAWDYRERRGLVYFPGPRDAWYTLNMSTVALPTSGKWFYATEEWGSAVERALFAHNDPLAWRRSAANGGAEPSSAGAGSRSR
jgi:hypothetical protein